MDIYKKLKMQPNNKNIRKNMRNYLFQQLTDWKFLKEKNGFLGNSNEFVLEYGNLYIIPLEKLIKWLTFKKLTEKEVKRLKWYNNQSRERIKKMDEKFIKYFNSLNDKNNFIKTQDSSIIKFINIIKEKNNLVMKKDKIYLNFNGFTEFCSLEMCGKFSSRKLVYDYKVME